MAADPLLSPDERAFLSRARQATLATTAPDGRPRLVPVCFVLGDRTDEVRRPLLYTPLDEKPKRVDDPRRLARVRDLLVLPDITLLVDHWDEDWTRLGWLRAYGRGELLEPQPHERQEHAVAVAALREKYVQYADQRLEDRPMIRVSLERVVSWGRLAADDGR